MYVLSVRERQDTKVTVCRVCTVNYTVRLGVLTWHTQSNQDKWVVACGILIIERLLGVFVLITFTFVVLLTGNGSRDFWGQVHAGIEPINLHARGVIKRA